MMKRIIKCTAKLIMTMSIGYLGVVTLLTLISPKLFPIKDENENIDTWDFEDEDL